MKLKFPCIQCGLCCRKSGHVPKLKNFLGHDGYCRYLTNDNKCFIYKIRPLICNIEAMYDTYFAKVMPEREFIRRNLEVCYKLNMEADNKEFAERLQLYLRLYS